MNAYKLWAYFKFRFKAIGRHGAHSPSLFSFIEFAKKHPESLEKKLGQFFNTSALIEKKLLTTPINLNEVGDDALIIIAAIHESKEHNQAWELLKTHPKVTRSIDFFSHGVIFINAAYKQEEHFIVRI